MEAVAALAAVAQAFVAVAIMPWFKRVTSKLKKKIRGGRTRKSDRAVVPYQPPSNDTQPSATFDSSTDVIDSTSPVAGLEREVQVAYFQFSFENAKHSREVAARDQRHLRVSRVIFVISIYCGLGYMLSRPYFGFPSRFLVSSVAAYFLYRLAPR